MNKHLPLIISPKQLADCLDQDDVIVVDLCQRYDDSIANAIPLEYSLLTAQSGKAMGLLPDEEELSEVCSYLGLTPDKHVVAYGDEGGGKAARLLWILDVIQHPHFSFLNGGIVNWKLSGYPTKKQRFSHISHRSSDYQAKISNKAWVDKHYVLEHINQADTVLLDARSVEEYQGSKKLAKHAGHIPSAIHWDWRNAFDPDSHCLYPTSQLQQQFASLGITTDKEVIVYCQTHHRSSHTYIVLKHLGFRHIKAYPGSWSEWGNEDSLPVEI